MLENTASGAAGGQGEELQASGPALRVLVGGGDVFLTLLEPAR